MGGATRRRRRLGQHFLSDRRAIASILAALAPAPEDRVLEVGPGRGALTLPLAGRVARLLAVEVDARLAAALAARLGEREDVEVLVEDILRLTPAAAARRLRCRAGQRLRVLGNLPYAIATPLIDRLLAAPALISDLTVMVQREVAERLLAAPGGPDFGALTVATQLRARARRVLNLGPGSFSPPPEVRSAVVRLTLRPAPVAAQRRRRAAMALARAAFGQRRKTLVNALRAQGYLATRVRRALETGGVPAAARPQELGPAAWLRLAARLAREGAAA